MIYHPTPQHYHSTYTSGIPRVSAPALTPPNTPITLKRQNMFGTASRRSNYKKPADRRLEGITKNTYNLRKELKSRHDRFQHYDDNDIQLPAIAFEADVFAGILGDEQVLLITLTSKTSMKHRFEY